MAFRICKWDILLALLALNLRSSAHGFPLQQAVPIPDKPEQSRPQNMGSDALPASVAICYNGAQLAAALVNPGIDTAQIPVDVVVKDQDWDGYTLPIVLQRNFVIEGTASRLVTLDLSFIHFKVRVGDKTTFTMRNVALQRWREGSSNQAPGMDMLVPLPPGETAFVVVEDSAYIWRYCFPPDVTQVASDMIIRPSQIPGLNQVNVTIPWPSNCSNDSSAHPLDRCWSNVGIHVDLGLPGADVDRVTGRVAPNGYLVHGLNVINLCEHNLSDRCVTEMGPLGCLLYMLASPPERQSSQDDVTRSGAEPLEKAAGGGAQRSGGGGRSGGDGGSGGSSSAGGGSSGGLGAGAVAGIVVGAVLGALLLLLVAALVIRRAHKRRRGGGVPQPMKGGHPPGGASSIYSASVWPRLNAASSFGDGIMRRPGGPAAAAAAAAATTSADTDAEAAEGGGCKRLRPSSDNATSRSASGRSSSGAHVLIAEAGAAGSQGGGDGGDGYTTIAAAPVSQLLPYYSRKPASSETVDVGDVVVTALTPARRSFTLNVVIQYSHEDDAGNNKDNDSGNKYISSTGIQSKTVEPPVHGDGGVSGGAGAPRQLPTVLPPPPSSQLRAVYGSAESWVPPSVSTPYNGRFIGGGGAIGGGGVDGKPSDNTVRLLPDTARGVGGFGRVVEGIYQGQLVAVKLVADEQQADTPSEALVRTFAQEVEVLGRCQHPNVVRLLAACLTPPRMCLVMELMETSLDGVLYCSPGAVLPLGKVVHVGVEVARALAYLHPTILHRDLKPANVLLNNCWSNRPVVKVTDFGLSRLRTTVLLTRNPDAGTPGYMAPECYDVVAQQEGVITHQADIFSLGVLLWEMLAGQRPWKRREPISVAKSVVDKRLRPSLQQLEGRCPTRLATLIRQCWDHDPLRRPAAAEAVKELLKVQQEVDAGGSPGANPAAVKRPLHSELPYRDTQLRPLIDHEREHAPDRALVSYSCCFSEMPTSTAAAELAAAAAAVVSAAAAAAGGVAVSGREQLSAVGAGIAPQLETYSPRQETDPAVSHSS